MKLINQHSLMINSFLRQEQSEMRGARMATVTVRVPVIVREILLAKARGEDLNFSQLCRRALRRELVENGITINGKYDSLLETKSGAQTTP